jgi:CheY-like chemotaxis protein
MRTLLITDDQEGVLHTLGYLFGEHGYRTLLAKSGAAALELARSEHIDAALIDVHMPAMDGFAVCRALCETAQAAGRILPIWLMTAAFTGTLAAKATEAGALTLLKKPFDCAQFLKDLERSFIFPSPIEATSIDQGGENRATAA